MSVTDKKVPRWCTLEPCNDDRKVTCKAALWNPARMFNEKGDIPMLLDETAKRLGVTKPVALT